MPRQGAILLSPTTLNIFVNCPRCFWLKFNRNIKIPRGIFPSLPGGMDSVIKGYFDRYRKQGSLPPELKGKVQGRLLGDIGLLNKWRDWRSSDLSYQDSSLGVKLRGALDDCLVEDGLYIPLDYKTRGYGLKGDPRKYYQLQLDCYCLILESGGYKTKALAYLVYYYPTKVSENGIVEFKVEVLKVNTSLENAKMVIKDAVVLVKGPLPAGSRDCEYCNFVQARCKSR